MPVYHFSLLIQAAGTALLFLLFLLLFQKIRRKAFGDWIASWAFLLGGLILLLLMPRLTDTRPFIFILHVFLLAHVVFLLRGVRRFRNEGAATGALELLWLIPLVAAAWWTSIEADQVSGRAAPGAARPHTVAPAPGRCGGPNGPRSQGRGGQAPGTVNTVSIAAVVVAVPRELVKTAR